MHDDFWLTIHKLSEQYTATGLTPQERAEALAERFLALPPDVRRELLDDLWPLACNLADVYTVMMSLNAKAERVA